MRILVFSDEKLTRSVEVSRLSANDTARIDFVSASSETIESLSGVDSSCQTGIFVVGSGVSEAVDTIRAWKVSLPLIAAVPNADVRKTVELLNSGCDDVVVVDVDPEELIARFRSVARRAASADTNSVQIGRLVAYLDGRDPEIDGKRVKLSNIEFSIIDTLARRAGRAVTREALFESVWPDSNHQPFDKVLDVHIHNLRKKLSDASGGERFVETLPSRGYILQGGMH